MPIAHNSTSRTKILSIELILTHKRSSLQLKATASVLTTQTLCSRPEKPTLLRMKFQNNSLRPKTSRKGAGIANRQNESNYLFSYLDCLNTQNAIFTKTHIHNLQKTEQLHEEAIHLFFVLTHPKDTFLEN